jgi:hypothetical protein
MVHPTRDELNLFVSNRLADTKRVQSVEAHITECEFCHEYCDLYRQGLALQSDADFIEITETDLLTADRIYSQAMAGRVVPLNLMTTAQSLGQNLMAADGSGKTVKSATNLATLYSEEPEMVLRVMRDFEHDIDYLQLIGTDPELTAHVLIQIPEIKKEYITDDLGRAVVPRGELGNVETLHWEIKLPDVRFDLRPVVYDPEHVESVREMTLETEQHDRILVTFTSKTAGKQILIRVLELDGQTNYDSVRVSISQQQLQEVKQLVPNQIVPFAIIDPNQGIYIRLYR